MPALTPDVLAAHATLSPSPHATRASLSRALQICCKGAITPGFSTSGGASCCGATPYVCATHICCKGVVLPGSVEQGYRCCGNGTTYDSNAALCCSGTVVPGFTTFAGDACCVGRGFNTRSQRCDPKLGGWGRVTAVCVQVPVDGVQAHCKGGCMWT